MKIKTQSENHLPSLIYDRAKWPRSVWTALTILPLLAGLLLNFPLKGKILGAVKGALDEMPCQLQYASIDLEYFLPKINIQRPSIPGDCLGLSGKDLELSKLEIRLRGPSFYPPGLKLLLTTQYKRSEINLYTTISWKKYFLKLDESSFNLEELAQGFSLPPLKGKLEATALLEIKTGEGLSALDFMLKSKDFLVGDQNIKGFQVPALPIGNFLLKVSGANSHTLMINEAVIGDDKSPIIGQWSGPLNLNLVEPMNSEVDLKGEIKFSEGFLKNFAILNLFLQKYRQNNGFYQIKMAGPLNAPRFSPM